MEQRTISNEPYESFETLLCMRVSPTRDNFVDLEANNTFEYASRRHHRRRGCCVFFFVGREYDDGVLKKKKRKK